MLTSLAYIFLVGLSMGAICQRLKFPKIIGMLATGIFYVSRGQDAARRRERAGVGSPMH